MVRVKLTAYEARALHTTAAILHEAVEAAVDREGLPQHPPGHNMPPLVSAMMKLETALMVEGEAV